MAKTRSLALADYPTGVYEFVEQTPNGLAGFVVEVARCTTATPTIWPSASSQIKVLVECSYDGGATFPADGGNAGFANNGGIVLDKQGAEIAVSAFTCRFSPVEPNAVRIRAEVIDGPIRTAVDVTVL